jgi:integrase
MARGINKLTAVKVNRLRIPGRYSDGGGLWLKISEGGGKSWQFRYTLQHVHRHMGLGPLHSVSLMEARERARQARQLLIDGADPITVKRDHAASLRLEAARAMTFAECAEQFLSVNAGTWKNDKHRHQWKSTLSTYAFPVFGSLPVQSIDTALVMKVLSPIWQEKRETAERVRGRIHRVLTWATAQQLRSGDNPAEWEILKHLLPNGKKQKAHHPALPYAELPRFISTLRDKLGVSALALEFCILTAARTSEVIGAKWNEIDLDEKVWTVPAERMKSNRPHRVPLSERALEILKGLNPSDDEMIFRNGGGRPLSNMAMLELVRGMRPGLTVHGFRSTFSDWCRDRTNYSRDVIEMALAHVIKDKTEAAYRRGDALDKRRRLMTEWARYCEQPAVVGDVVSIRA